MSDEVLIELAKEVAEAFLERGAQETKVYIYPRDIEGIPNDRVIEVRITFKHRSKVENVAE